MGFLLTDNTMRNDEYMYTDRYNKFDNMDIAELCDTIRNDSDKKVHTIVDEKLLKMMKEFFQKDHSSEDVLVSFRKAFKPLYQKNDPHSYMSAILACLFLNEPSASGETLCFKSNHPRRVIGILNIQMQKGLKDVDGNRAYDEIMHMISTHNPKTKDDTAFCQKKHLTRIIETLNPGTGPHKDEDTVTSIVAHIKQLIDGLPKTTAVKNDTVSKEQLKTMYEEVMKVLSPEAKVMGDDYKQWIYQVVDALIALHAKKMQKIRQISSYIDAHINRYQTYSTNKSQSISKKTASEIHTELSTNLKLLSTDVPLTPANQIIMKNPVDVDLFAYLRSGQEKMITTIPRPAGRSQRTFKSYSMPQYHYSPY